MLVGGSADRPSVRSGPASVLAGRATQEEGPLGVVLGHAGRSGELAARLVVAAEPGEQVAADARQQVVVGEGFGGDEPVDDLERGLRTLGVGQRDGTVEVDDGRRADRTELGVCLLYTSPSPRDS